MHPILMILVSVFAGVAGQLVLKSGVTRIGPLALNANAPAVVQRLTLNPTIWIGLGLYGVGTLFWLVALSQVELSFAYPFISLSYVLIVLASRFLFREEVSTRRLFAVAVIVLGVVAVTRG